MKSFFRDRQALKRLRKMERSASLRLGEHLTRAFIKPWRIPLLPISFPYLIGRITFERLGWASLPETRVEWERPSKGNGLLVYIDGFSDEHARGVLQDLHDLAKIQSQRPVSIICTSNFQHIFHDTSFPTFILPTKAELSKEHTPNWGDLIEEQIGGIASFIQPSMVLVVGPYPHRALKNLRRSNPEISLILDQRPQNAKRKKVPSGMYTHLSGVLRERDDESFIPDGINIHRVDNIGLASWIGENHSYLQSTDDETSIFFQEQTKYLLEVTKKAKRDTLIISKTIDELNISHGIEKTYSLLMYAFIIIEQKDESKDKKLTRDLFVSAIRSLGKTNLEHMLELANWRLPRYQDERAAKSIIQFLKNAERNEEAPAFLKYVDDKEWKQREIKNVTKKLFKQYGILENTVSAKYDLTTLGTEELEIVISEGLEANSIIFLDDIGKRLSKGSEKERIKFCSRVLIATRELHHPLIHQFLIQHTLFVHESKRFAELQCRFFLMYGDAKSALEVLTNGPQEELTEQIKKTHNILAKIDGTWLSSIPALHNNKKHTPKENEILYLAHMSLPFESAGYCTRTHGLLTNLLGLNSGITVHGRFGYPLDKGKLRHLAVEDVVEKIDIDGLTYRFDRDIDLGITDPDEVAYIERASSRLLKHALKSRASCIQAASNHVNGAIGLNTAKALDIPFIYEVRGLWHMSRVARQPHFYEHAEYHAMDAAEIAICKEADIVLAITHAVRYYLIDNGVEGERIFVLPNGVDTKRFNPLSADEKLRQQIGLSSGPVIGYVGSFVRYEGLELLIEAFSGIAEKHDNVNLLLVGDGETRASLEKQVKELNLLSRVFFTGRVAHDEVEMYHSLIDIAPFPRTPDIVCEYISPLKPFESMAMGQVVVASNVAALSEIISDGKNGRLFKKGDSHHLCEVLSELLSDSKQMKKLSKAGRIWVSSNRDWNNLAKYLHSIHRYLLMGEEKPKIIGEGRRLEIVNKKVVTRLDRKPNIMVIMDEFSTTALEPDANLIRPTPENWSKLLEEQEIDILLVESAWEGNDKSWHHKVGWYSEEEMESLIDLTQTCRRRNIPTLFYNKEDPVHFNRFSKTSELFDHIFTTDINCISRYEELISPTIKSVQPIQFSAQPKYHHSYDTTFASRNGIAFAGTYYSGKYPKRCERMDQLLDASHDHDLIIYDRQSDGDNPQYVFPERFKNSIKPKIEYVTMLERHRQHLLFLNINSVESSPTMAARRIFEIPASGAGLVSGPGLAMQEIFGNIIPVVNSHEQSSKTIQKLLNHPEFIKYTIQRSSEVIRNGHLNYHRLDVMLLTASFKIDSKSRTEYSIHLLDTKNSLTKILLWLALQEYCENIIVLPNKPSTVSELALMTLLQSRGWNLTHTSSAQFTQAINIFDITNFDHNGVRFLRDILISSKESVEIQLESGDVIAICEKRQSKSIKTLEYFAIGGKSSLSISTVFEKIENISAIPGKLLVAGHDLKFALPIMKVLEGMGIEILVDKWNNHENFSQDKSMALLAQADAVWCEWALGNVEWYSKAIKSETPLFVRYHLQEREKEYLGRADNSSITKIGFVCEYYMHNALKIGQIENMDKCEVIPNALEVSERRNPKNNNFKIGFVGMVPSRKRIDLAIDLLERLLLLDDRYELNIIGKGPDDFKWLQQRQVEREYYEEISRRIEDSQILSEKVNFLGYVDDIHDFYASMGHVISTSDFESFHLTLADGPLQGAAAHTLPWLGADTIYSDLWIRESISEMADKIHELNQTNMTSYHSYLQSKHLIPQMQIENIALQILACLDNVKGSE
jgi:glycosyltransferase involved in cell wall biosynthesis/spore maturation protein CgeB